MRRMPLLLAGSALAAFGIIAACSFPEVDFAPAGGSSGSSGSSGSAQDGNVPGDAGSSDGSSNDALANPDGPPDPDGGFVEKPDSGDCKNPPCDCDGDGYQAKGGTCGGDDCDDDDDRAHPGQSFLKDPPTKTTKGDWNCDGKVERLVSAVNEQCSGTCSSPREGFAVDIACSQVGQYNFCNPGFLNACTLADSGAKQQECR